MKTKKIISIFFLLCFQLIFNKNIIFDLGGVLIKRPCLESFPEIAWKVGPITIVKYVVKNGKISVQMAHDRLFEFANLNFKITDSLQQWYSGLIRTSEIESKLRENIDNCYYKYFFKNEEERQLLKNAIIFFNPDTIASISGINKDGLNVVKECKQNGHMLFVLSDWDKESFPLVVKKMPELFDLFDKEKIVISGNLGTKKPEKKIYYYMIQHFGLNPEDCIFIDDTEANVIAAIKCGINGIHHKKDPKKWWPLNDPWKRTRHELVKLGVLA